MTNFLFTSEAVAIGHPDKLADQISDAIVDTCLAQDPHSRVACETLVTGGLVLLSGEITTTATIDHVQAVRDTIYHAGYNDCSLGFDYRSCGILNTINKQFRTHGVYINSRILQLINNLEGFICIYRQRLFYLPMVQEGRKCTIRYSIYCIPGKEWF